MITPLSQRDARWRDIPLGDSGLTLGSHGCTLTAIAMMLQNFGHQETPANVLARMQAVGGIQKGTNFIIWNALEKAYPGLRFLGRDYGIRPEFDAVVTTPAALHQRAVKRIRVGSLALIQVRSGANVAKPDHWILGIKSDPFTIIDPWDGVEIEFLRRYGDPDTQVLGLAGYYAHPGTAEEPTLVSLAFKASKLDAAIRKPELATILAKIDKPELTYEIETYSKEIFKDILDPTV